MPYTMDQLKYSNLSFGIKNYEDLEKKLGKRISDLKTDDRLYATAIFKDYTFNYSPNSDKGNVAQLVRIVYVH